MDGATDRIVTEVLDATAERNWDHLKLLLQPYLHWYEPTAALTRRGRTNVLRWLMKRPVALARAEEVELRDGQIYRSNGGL